MPRTRKARALSCAPRAFAITTLPPVPTPSPMAVMSEATGHKKVDGGQAHVTDALADVKAVYNNEKPVRSWGSHGRQHIVEKFCLRALYVCLHGGVLLSLVKRGPEKGRA